MLVKRSLCYHKLADYHVKRTASATTELDKKYHADQANISRAMAFELEKEEKENV